MKSPTILFASFNLVGMSSHARFLQSKGFEVLSVFNKTELMTNLDRHYMDIDTIVMDVLIPGLEVYDVSDFIAMRRDEPIPIIGIAEFPRDEELLMNAGDTFGLILEKGFSPEELLEALTTLQASCYRPEGLVTDEQRRARLALQSDLEDTIVDGEEVFSHAQLRNYSHQKFLDSIGQDD